MESFAMQPFNLDLYLAMHERNVVLNGIWLFSPEAIDRRVMGAIVKAFPRIVAAVIDDPALDLDAIRVLVHGGVRAGEVDDA